jgi:hypothetical protein
MRIDLIQQANAKIEALGIVTDKIAKLRTKRKALIFRFLNARREQELKLLKREAKILRSEALASLGIAKDSMNWTRRKIETLY